MFTGIVANKYPVEILSRSTEFMKISVDVSEDFIAAIKIGDSVAVNGVCLTLAKYEAGKVYFDVIKETIAVTTFKDIKSGSLVNLERSLKFGDEIGGHLLSGHVDVTASVKKIIKTKENCAIEFVIDSSFSKYIFLKGYVAINGVSLTVNSSSNGVFSVNLIPETLFRTNLSELQEGDSVNIEIDRNTQIIVDTVKSYFNNK